MPGLDDFMSAPGVPGAPGSADDGKPKEDPGSFSDYGDDAKDAGKDVAGAATDNAKDEALKKGADMADGLIQDALAGKPPDPGAIKDQAFAAAKDIAHSTGEAAIGAAKQQAQQQVDKTLAIIGNEFPMLGGILGILSKPVIDQALNKCQMPDF
ncbi:MAG: hypothetical protein EOO22_20000 [Comamonadaceae bacterium]|nr:MAG: hypothetical protein EOO22_20000 [Comamonadaceae bacterium]